MYIIGISALYGLFLYIENNFENDLRNLSNKAVTISKMTIINFID